ncbi:MAG: HK97 gp10 family phage protein [Clostridiales bacterium]|nr:HK97 gp10 family phage protein [Clostridiales bacterium]
MAKMGKLKISNDLKKLQKKLKKLQSSDMDAFIDECAKELAARLLAKVIKRTPVGDYSEEVEVVAKKDSKNHKKGDIYTKRVNKTGKMGGTLRRGWTSETHEDAEGGSGKGMDATAYVESLMINHVGNMLYVDIINPVEYASYVEYGHRQQPGRYVPAIGKQLKNGWVPGHFMLTISEREIQDIAPKLLESKINKFLKENMK